jgi:hypothetical protein
MWYRFAKNIVKLDTEAILRRLKIKFGDNPSINQIKEFVKVDLGPLIKRQVKIGRQTLPPELADDFDDIANSLIDDLINLCSGEYSHSDYCSYIITDDDKTEIDQIIKDPKSSVGRLLLYSVDDFDVDGNYYDYIEALENLVENPMDYDKFLYLEDFCIIDNPAIRGKVIMQIINRIIDAIEKTGLPLLASCRESTSYRLIQSEMVQRYLARHGIKVGQPVLMRNYANTGENFYVIAVAKV